MKCKCSFTFSTFVCRLVVKLHVKRGPFFGKKLHTHTHTQRMLEGKAQVRDTDMPLKMQIHAMSTASQALDQYDVLDCTSIAAHIKKEFDKIYGSGWQCVVGSNFSCFFTHSQGSFIYFALETLNFLIFKGASS